MKRLFAEPFFQFLILGALLYVLVSFIQKQRDNDSREIIMDNDRVNLMIENYATQTGQLPTKQQVDALINDYIKEEINYREAKKMGLDKDDEIIRRRLSQKYEFLHADLEETDSPKEEQLKEFYKNNPSLFSSDARVSFSHIYFSTDNSSDSAAKQKALKVLLQLKNSNIQHAPEKGDHFPLQYDYTDQSLLDIKQNFGDKPIADSLFHAATNTWTGPVQSGYGWHLLFISKRDSSNLLSYESVKADVQSKYMDAEKEKQNRAAFEAVSKNYIIKREYLDSK
jgi:parvulin-like peptidyl-prolyl isomerase